VRAGEGAVVGAGVVVGVVVAAGAVPTAGAAAAAELGGAGAGDGAAGAALGAGAGVGLGEGDAGASPGKAAVDGGPEGACAKLVCPAVTTTASEPVNDRMRVGDISNEWKRVTGRSLGGFPSERTS
jgi:hypothetical protein